MIISKIKLWPGAIVLTLLLAACAAAAPPAQITVSPVGSPPPAGQLTAQAAVQSAPKPTVPPAATNVRTEPDKNYSIPASLLPPDGIAPVYNPQFAQAADAPLQDDELVIGVALGDQAKAYPITVLRFREMVNDELSGMPILVTW